MNKISHNYIEVSESILFCGKEFDLATYTTLSFPTEILPTEGQHDYNNCQACQISLKEITENLKNRYWGNEKKKAFPDCCEYHSQLKSNPHFVKKHYDKVPQLTAEKIIFTRQHISNYIFEDNWKKEISDYIEYCIESFGSMPKDCGSPLFIEEYIVGIKSYLDAQKSFSKEKIDFILIAIDPNKNKEKPIDLKLLLNTYEKWIKTFPFALNQYFKDLREYFETNIQILNGKQTVNKYSGIIKAEIHTPETLVEELSKKTKELLSKVNTTELLEQGLISNLKKHRLELANEELRIATERITKDFSKGELRYIKTLKKWLELHSKYFKEIEPLIATKNDINDEKQETIIGKFEDLFINKESEEAFLQILRLLNPSIINSEHVYIGKNKGIFPLLIKVFKNHKPVLIQHTSDVNYKDLLNHKFKGLNLSKDASEFRKSYSRLEKNRIELDIKSFLSQFSQSGKLGK